MSSKEITENVGCKFRLDFVLFNLLEVLEWYIPNNFKLVKLDIKEIANKDPYFEEYFLHGEDRYEDYLEDEYPSSDHLYNPVVIVNDSVIDGYNRVTMLYKLGEKKVDAYVNI